MRWKSKARVLWISSNALVIANQIHWFRVKFELISTWPNSKHSYSVQVTAISREVDGSRYETAEYRGENRLHKHIWATESCMTFTAEECGVNCPGLDSPQQSGQGCCCCCCFLVFLCKFSFVTGVEILLRHVNPAHQRLTSCKAMWYERGLQLFFPLTVKY